MGYDDDDDDDDDYDEYSKLKKKNSFSSPSRYFCFFKKGLRISPGELNESDKDEPECELNSVPSDTIILATDFLDRYRQYWKYGACDGKRLISATMKRRYPSPRETR